ncbi:hypothetical protein [Infirmifilum sp.]|uniref:hypothetical protein n=1 Tax=Infirmifilum sp. TaxID=2856575 RepID=UPI003D14EA01
MSTGFSYAFTFVAKRRGRPNYEYQGVLSTHRLYIKYYSLLEGQDPLRAVVDNKEKIAFPARFAELLVDFARDLGGEAVGTRRVKVPGRDVYYDKQVVVLPNEVAFKRHLLFALTAATYSNPNGARLNALRSLILSMNANFLNILCDIAIDRYKSQNPARYWHMMRVGRAVKALYMLD